MISKARLDPTVERIVGDCSGGSTMRSAGRRVEFNVELGEYVLRPRGTRSTTSPQRRVARSWDRHLPILAYAAQGDPKPVGLVLTFYRVIGSGFA